MVDETSRVDYNSSILYKMFMKSPIEWMLVSGLLMINSQKGGANLIIQQNYTTSNDGSLVYKCQFNVEVAACFWKVNGTTQSPGASGFDYIDGKKGISTKNCSIKFKKDRSFKNNSSVICSGQIESAVKHIKMVCNFSKRVNCYWKRNEVIINIVQRYVYANGDGRNTTDCSIIINDVSNIDNGIWKCGTQLNNDTEVIYSIINRTVIYIWNLTKIEKTTEQMKPITESKSTPNDSKNAFQKRKKGKSKHGNSVQNSKNKMIADSQLRNDSITTTCFDTSKCNKNHEETENDNGDYSSIKIDNHDDDYVSRYCKMTKNSEIFTEPSVDLEVTEEIRTVSPNWSKIPIIYERMSLWKKNDHHYSNVFVPKLIDYT